MISLEYFHESKINRNSTFTFVYIAYAEAEQANFIVIEGNSRVSNEESGVFWISSW